jgi:hypothetical protein
LPLSERARIEVYLPDLPRTAYQGLLTALEQEFSYAFGGCSTVRGLEGNYLSQAGPIIRDRVNLIYTDTPFGLEDHRSVLSRYAEELREAAAEALDEEAILIVVFSIFHAE